MPRAGRYETRERIGRGGMGVVFRAYDPTLRRDVAVKRLFPDDATDPDARRRVLREARAMARVEHPNVVKIFDVGSDDGGVFIAMELLRGPTMRAWVETNIGWRRIVSAFVSAGRGLNALHEAGLVQNDFKPDNVMFAANDEPRVMDLGLARRAWDAETLDGDESVTDGKRPHFVPAGSFPYMAPELLEGAPPDQRSDQFAFFASLYEVLTGAQPFEAATPWAHWDRITTGGPAARPSRTIIPRRLMDIIERGLRADAEERYPTLSAALRDLAALTRRRRSQALLSGFVVLAATAFVGVPLDETPPPVPTEVCAEPIDLEWTDQARTEGISLESEAIGIDTAPQNFLNGRITRAVDHLQQLNDQPCTTPAQSQCRATIAVRLRAVMTELDRAGEPSNNQMWDLGTLLDPRCEGLPRATTDRRDDANVEALLAAAKVAALTGDVAGVRRAARDAIAAADASDDVELASSVRSRAGRALIDAGDPDGGVELLEDGAWQASRNGPHQATELALGIAHHFSAVVHDAERAEMWIERAKATAPDPLPGHIAARFVAERALVARSRGEFIGAEVNMRAAAEFRTRFDPDGAETAETWAAVGAILQHQGRFEEAKEIFQTVVADLGRILAPEHPKLAVALYGLAVCHFQLGQFARAEIVTRQVLKVETLAHGERFPYLAADYTLLAEILTARGRPDEASKAFEAALDHAASLPDGHPLRMGLEAAAAQRATAQP